jgi:NhaP-type Na+/H+ or K+/H+ antiporter
MYQFNMGLLLIAGSALVLGLFSKSLKRIGLPDATNLLLLGVITGPMGFGLLDPAEWGKEMVILEQVARLALAIGLMGTALRLPRAYFFKHWRSLAVVLAFGMLFMWLVSSLLVGWAFGLSAGVALLIGAIITPTDPVVASTIVTGPVAKADLPPYLRHIISGEAGANDGLTYLFVMVIIFVLTLPPSESMTTHVLGVFLWDIVGAVLLGAAIGHGAGVALRKAEEKEIIEQPSVLVLTIALALTTLAAVKLIGSDGILAVFVAGLAFDLQVDAKERQQEERVVEGVDRFFTSPIFILLGLMIPWQEWLSLSWPVLMLVVGVLLLRRLPLFLVLAGRLKDLPREADGAFAGWFGPIGVAALYYVALAHHKTDVPDLWPIVSLVVTSSIVIHGFTSVPFSHLYRRQNPNKA